MYAGHGSGAAAAAVGATAVFGLVLPGAAAEPGGHGRFLWHSADTAQAA